MGAVVLGRLRPASAASEAVSYFSLFGVSRSHLEVVRGRGLNPSSEVVRGRDLNPTSEVVRGRDLNLTCEAVRGRDFNLTSETVTSNPNSKAI